MDDDQNRALRALLDMLSERMTTTADSTGTLGRTMTAAERELKKLERQYKDAAESVKELKEGLGSGSKSALENATALADLERKLKSSSTVIDQETQKRIDQIKSATKWEAGTKGAIDTLQTITTAGIDFAIKSTQDLVKNLLGTGDAFNAATAIAKNGVNALNASAQTAAKGIGEMGEVVAILSKGPLRLLGIAAMAAGKLLSYFAEKTKDQINFALDTLNDEIHKTIKVFNDNSKAGMFFANGMDALTQDLNQAGMSYREFFGALKNSSADLALLGGNAGAGAEAVKRTFKAMEPFKMGLLNLGINLEEQVQGAAEYMNLMARSNALKGKSDADLAKGTDAYLTNLKLISSITGEEAKAAQARARKAAEQFAVQNTLSKLGGTAAEKFNFAIKQLPSGMTSAVQQLLEGNTVSDPETAAALAQTPKLLEIAQQYVRDIRDESVSSTDAINRYNAAIQDPALKAQLNAAAQGYGFANTMTGAYGGGNALLSETARQGMTAGAPGFAGSRERVEGQKTTDSELTKGVSKATIEFSKMQALLETKLNPVLKDFAILVSGQMVEFAKKVNEVIAWLERQKNGNSPPPPGVPVVTGNDVNKKREGQGLPALSPDVAEAEAARQQAEEGYRRRNENRLRRKEGLPPLTPDLPQKADGGVVNSPSIAGEAGPEAVIPLKNGSIPVKIDLGPMIAAMSESLEVSREMLRELKESRDIQGQILNASY